MHTVLIIEADDHALRARGDELLLDGYEVVTAQTDKAARVRLADRQLDGVVLGRLDSAAASLSLLRDLRRGVIAGADPRVPVLSLGADPDDVAVRYYEAGADIALPSSASPMLLTSALAALAARVEGQRHRMLRVGPITIDLDARQAAVEDRSLRLTRIEFDLLRTLAYHAHTVVTREQFAKEVWHTELVVGRTIDSHAARLRTKLGDAGHLLQTVHGIGYRLGR